MATKNTKPQDGDAVSSLSSSDMLAILEACMQSCDHQIPYYAYGDNQAACDMSNRLRQIGDDLRIVAESFDSANVEVRNERSELPAPSC